MFERIKIIALMIRYRTTDLNKVIEIKNQEVIKLMAEHKAMLERKKAEKQKKK